MPEHFDKLSATPKRPLKVFLCHAHADRDPVRGLYARLTQDGVDAWLDKEKLLPGQDWELEIRKAVREADVVVVCLSKQFNQAGFRQQEVRWALDTAMKQPEEEIFIIPARLEECNTLESLRKWHWVDLFEEYGYEMLMRALRARADKIGTTSQIKRSWLPKVPASPVKSEQHPTSIERPSKSKQEKPESKPKLIKRKLNSQNVIIFIVLVVLILVSLFGLPSLIGNPEPTHEAIITPTLSQTDIIDGKGVPMVSVPAGEFIMGSDSGYQGEWPARKIYLDTFYVDKYEVTNTYYENCVADGVCQLPTNTSTERDTNYYDNPDFKNYPVVYVNWEMANVYCKWRGGELPTEAQWEKAARGIDGRMYPWGDEINCSYANYYDTPNNRACIGGTTEVGSYPLGISPYGAYDMIGNVWEWVAGWYSETYYQILPTLNPPGASSGQSRMIRGSSWYGLEDYARTSYRGWVNPYHSVSSLGIRCVYFP